MECRWSLVCVATHFSKIASRCHLPRVHILYQECLAKCTDRDSDSNTDNCEQSSSPLSSIFWVDGVTIGRFEHLISDFKTSFSKDINVKCGHELLFPLSSLPSPDLSFSYFLTSCWWQSLRFFHLPFTILTETICTWMNSSVIYFEWLSILLN